MNNTDPWPFVYVVDINVVFHFAPTGVASLVYEHLPLEMLDLTYTAAICKVRSYILLTCEMYVTMCPYELCKVE